MDSDTNAAMKPGEARCPGPSARDVILADGCSVPEALISQSYTFRGDADMPYDNYTSQEFFNREMKSVWGHTWQWVCREEHMPESGDYVTYDIGPWSVILVRGDDGVVRGFHNACMHRATQFRPSETMGYAPQLRCPYHGWTWDLDGELKEVPCAWDFPHVTADTHRLPQVRVEKWGGFLWINLDDKAPSLIEYLGVMPQHFTDAWDTGKRYVYMHVRKELPTNWKAAMEAFLEAYHVLETHNQNLPASGDANTQYDVFGDHITRFVQNIGYPSPHLVQKPSEQEIIGRLRAVADAGLTVPEGRSARSVAAEYLRQKLSAEWDFDLSTYSDAEILDSINYNVFPNANFFPGITHPMVYRFRPIGMEPGRCVFDLLFMRPLAPGAEMPDPPEPIKLGEDDLVADVPGILRSLAHLFDQDVSNLRLQYRGFQASQKRGQTLGNYQEIRIRHLHEMILTYMAKYP